MAGTAAGGLCSTLYCTSSTLLSSLCAPRGLPAPRTANSQSTTSTLLPFPKAAQCLHTTAHTIWATGEWGKMKNGKVQARGRRSALGDAEARERMSSTLPRARLARGSRRAGSSPAAASRSVAALKPPCTTQNTSSDLEWLPVPAG